MTEPRPLTQQPADRELPARRTDQVRWRTAVQAVQRDIVKVLASPAIVARFWVDLEPAQRFLHAHTGSPKLTYTHLFVKAAGLAALACPPLHRMHGPLSVLDPGHADVSVSVDGLEMLASMIVVPEVDRKPLSTIAEELRTKAKQVREAEHRDHPRMNRYLGFLRFFPFPQLARAVTRALLMSPRFRRKIGGTIQFSNIGHFGIESADVPFVMDLLLVGGVIHKRPVVNESGELAVGFGAEFTLHGSHLKINGQTAGKFIDAFRDVMSRPEDLA